MAKRIFLFGLVNILIIFMLSLVINLLGLESYLNYYGGAYGINYQSLMVFCLFWGMGGALISLLLSKKMAKWMMKVQFIPHDTPDQNLASLVQMVHKLAAGAGLQKMPDVGIYHSPEVNAFATGPTKNNSLVAVSSGLLQKMSRDELEGVLSHEVAHIANGDMVTMTLIQGVVNAFVMFFARVVAFAVSQFLRGDDEEGPGFFVQFALVMVFQMVFGLLGMMVVGWFSRWREFRADAGGASLAGRNKMIAALDALKDTTDLISKENEAVASLKISGKFGGLMAFMSTHPPLDQRIMRLKEMAY